MREYNAALGKLSEFCEFIDALNDTLRDRFVRSQKRSSCQSQILSTRRLLTYKWQWKPQRMMQLNYRVSIFHRPVLTKSTHNRQGRETRTTTIHDLIHSPSPVSGVMGVIRRIPVDT